MINQTWIAKLFLRSLHGRDSCTSIWYIMMCVFTRRLSNCCKMGIQKAASQILQHYMFINLIRWSFQTLQTWRLHVSLDSTKAFSRTSAPDVSAPPWGRFRPARTPTWCEQQLWWQLPKRRGPRLWKTNPVLPERRASGLGQLAANEWSRNTKHQWVSKIKNASFDAFFLLRFIWLTCFFYLL